mgnify:CR=1 FL=1
MGESNLTVRLFAAAAVLALGLTACATTEAPNSAAAMERCMSVDLTVNVTDDDQIIVNDAPTDREGFLAAARAKDAVCDNAGAMVFFTRPESGSPNTSFVRATLIEEVENLALIEAARGSEDPAKAAEPSDKPKS